jgi:endo-1,4-beta-xylanase
MKNQIKSVLILMAGLAFGQCLPAENQAKSVPGDSLELVQAPDAGDSVVEPPAEKPDPSETVKLPKPVLISEVKSRSGVEITSRSKPKAEKQYSNRELKHLLPFKLGAAVKAGGMLKDKSYKAVFYNYFNSMTLENAMKMGPLQPKEGIFDFKAADVIVNDALTKGIRVHGHCLVWRNVPAWVKNFKGDKADWEKLLKTHIQTVVKHFRGRVTSWDVVNEMFKKGGGLESADKNIWIEKIGEDVINKAFIWAHEADPEALLFYNDFDLQYTNKKTQSCYDWAKSCKANGVPLHGIGNQMHTDVNLNLGEFERNTRRFAGLGLLIHISELDVRVGAATPNSAQEQKKSKAYSEIFRIYNKVVKPNQQYGITTWGLGKGDWYLNAGASKGKWVDDPLLLTEEMAKTPAYMRLVKEFSN